MDDLRLVLGTSAFWVFVLFFVKRHYDRRDQLQDRRIAGYDSVFEALALLRSAANHLGENSYGGDTTPSQFTPIWELMKKTKDTIEIKRLPTGPVFANTAMLIVKRWEIEMLLLAQARWEAEPQKPTLDELDRRLYDAIPLELKKRIAPGTLADLEQAEKEAAALAKKKAEEAKRAQPLLSATITVTTSELTEAEREK